jgi:hypothetical protein
MLHPPKPEIGSTWADNDPRITREVVVIALSATHATVRNVKLQTDSKVAFKYFFRDGKKTGFSRKGF